MNFTLTRLFWIFCLLFLAQSTLGQQVSFGHEDITVLSPDGTPFDMAFAGGINSGQFSNIDLNGDGQQDLMLFDRTSNKITTFLFDGKEYQYAPEYAYQFPPFLINWILLKDYNGDGLTDIFTSTNLGIKVYQQKGRVDDKITWELVADPILTLGSSIINLFVNSTDLPAITDIDGDGDLDIMVFNFASGGFVEFHQNMSIENHGNADHLEFVRITRSWGDFQECFCGTFAYAGVPCFTSGRTEHVAGKAITLTDLNNDGQHDLLFGEELCSNLFVLDNEGEAVAAVFRDGRIAFDALEDAMYYPAAYEVQLYDQVENSLIISPNDRINELDLQDFTSSVYLMGKTEGKFALQERGFLQKNMIDLGEHSTPAFGDLTGNGQPDLLVGVRGRQTSRGFRGTLAFFENLGTIAKPSFALREENFLDLSRFDFLSIRPKIVDVDGDGLQDIVFAAAADRTSNLYWIRQTESGFTSDPVLLTDLAFNPTDTYAFADVDGDNVQDLVLGTSSGRLDLYLNQGVSLAQPNFTLAQSGYLGINTNPSRTNLGVEVVNPSEGLKPDLLLYDDSGELRIVRDFTSPNPIFEEITLSENDASLQMGRLGTLAVSSLGATDQTFLLMGTAQGGLFLFHFPAESSSTTNWEVRLYPNPSAGTNLEVATTVAASGDLISLSGQILQRGLQFSPGTATEINISNLAQGMYLLRLATPDGQKRTLRFIVNDR